MSDNVIALFELTLENGDPLIVEERHYRLVPADRIEAVGPADIRRPRLVLPVELDLARYDVGEAEPEWVMPMGTRISAMTKIEAQRVAPAAQA